MSKHYDIIIVGAGMVGASLAIALSQHKPFNIALIEAQPLSPLKATDPIDLRVCAINQASKTILTNLGIWSLLMSERIADFRDMLVWETSEDQIHFDSAEIGESLLGHILENRHFQQACLQRCQQLDNIDLLCPEKPSAMEGKQLILESGQTLTADLIVGADGARSPLRDWAGISTSGWDYEQKGIVCTVTTEYPHDHIARQRFFATGPLAFLPLPDPHQCSIVWSNDSDKAEHLQQLNDEDFSDELSKAFENSLGKVISISQRGAFPLMLSHADNYVSEGFALVGDAAHTIHPLAGQGVNIGLLDAATLAEIVIDAAEKGRNIGSLHTLSKYQRRRKGDNFAIQLTMDAFKRVFGSPYAPVKLARHCGFRLVENSGFLKRLFMQQASGHRFANPDLSRRP
jgi:2-octaprenylphenol hydroxylase